MQLNFTLAEKLLRKTYQNFVDDIGNSNRIDRYDQLFQSEYAFITEASASLLLLCVHSFSGTS